ncbi:MAG: T9SS type A sorting domain-containing protein [Bacteroidales bacterium]|jgi:hypothetical protein
MKPKENSKCCRRLFIKNSIAATAGLTMLGSGIKLFAEPTDEWYWYGFCTNRCDICEGCNGCKDPANLGSQCPQKRCCIDVKNIPTCAHCDELATCENFDDWPDLRAQALELQESINATSIDNINAEEYSYKIFPNPSTESLNIKSNRINDARYELIDFNGKLRKQGALTSNSQFINISGMPSGNYILRILVNKKQVFSKKLIIQKQMQ